MAAPAPAWPNPIVERPDGSRWRLDPPIKTSDGFLLSNGWLLDEDDEPAHDEGGFPILHSFFLGSAS